MDLGIEDDRFWSMAPRRLFALLDRFDALERRQDLRFGLIASLLYNPHRKKGAKALKPDDFFPGKRLKRPRKRRGE